MCPTILQDGGYSGHETVGASAVSRKLRQKARLADVTLARESDMGVNDNTVTVRSHLGNILKAGDAVLGYDMTSLVIPADEMADARADNVSLPDVVLVKKHYPKWNRRTERYWKLQRVKAEEEDNLRRADMAKRERDYENFLRELEEDKQMREQVNLYKDESRADVLARLARGERIRPEGMEEEEAEDRPLVGLDELLDEMTLDDAHSAEAAAKSGAEGSDVMAHLAAKYGLSPDAPAFKAVLEALQRSEDPAAAKASATSAGSALSTLGDEEAAGFGGVKRDAAE